MVCHQKRHPVTWRRPWHGGITNEWVASQTPVSLAGGAATLSVIGQVDTPPTHRTVPPPGTGCGRTQPLELLSVPLWHSDGTRLKRAMRSAPCSCRGWGHCCPGAQAPQSFRSKSQRGWGQSPLPLPSRDLCCHWTWPGIDEASGSQAH